MKGQHIALQDNRDSYNLIDGIKNMKEYLSNIKQ